MSPERDYFVDVSRLKLHVVEWGDPENPPLVLIHGGKDHARNWDQVAAGLCDRYRVIAPDLRGHGDSGWSADADYSFSDHVADIAQLFDVLGLQVFRLVGHSMGGNVVTRYTGLFPDRVRKLVNIEGLGMGPDIDADHLRAWVMGKARTLARTPARYPDIETAMSRLTAVNPRLSADQARHLALTGTRPCEDGGVAFKFDPAMDLVSSLDVPAVVKHALWSAISCPVLLVYGADSWAPDPSKDGRLARFRDARVEVFDNAAHWVQHDRPADFIRVVRDFLAD